MTMKQFSKKGDVEKKLEEANRDILPYDKLTNIINLNLIHRLILIKQN